jgi:hypothetical protein
MLSCFKKGLIRVFIYYALGIAMILIFHLVAGWDYAYAPPLSNTLFALLLLCGLPLAGIKLPQHF